MTDTNRQARGRSMAATKAMGGAAGVGLAAAACAKEAPTQPARELTPAAILAIAPDARAAAGALLDDASVRLMPSLADAAARARLRGFLEDLSAALEADNAAKARRQIALARKMIAALADSPDAADLAVLGVALDQVETQLNGASAHHLEP